MTNVEGMTKHESQMKDLHLFSSFGFCHCFVIRHSSFDLRHLIHVGADVLFARRVIERVAWIFDNGRVPPWIGIRAQSKQHLARLMHVAIFVHCNDVLAEHHLSHAPQPMHYFESLIRILLPDADKNQVMKHPFRRQRYVHDLGKIQLEDRQKNSNGGVADVEVFHWRFADDGCRINRIPSVRDRGDMRAESMKITPNAILSRNLAAVVDQALVIALPGKPSGAVECLSFVQGAIPHGVAVAQGTPTSC